MILCTYTTQRREGYIVDMDIDSRIAAGIDLLNEHGPVEWWSEEHILLDVLDIADTTNCVLGQIYGGYWDGLDRLADHVSYERGASKLGFTLLNSGQGDFEMLTERWRQAIQKIRDEVAA